MHKPKKPNLVYEVQRRYFKMLTKFNDLGIPDERNLPLVFLAGNEAVGLKTTERGLNLSGFVHRQSKLDLSERVMRLSSKVAALTHEPDTGKTYLEDTLKLFRPFEGDKPIIRAMDYFSDCLSCLYDTGIGHQGLFNQINSFLVILSRSRDAAYHSFIGQGGEYNLFMAQDIVYSGHVSSFLRHARDTLSHLYMTQLHEAEKTRYTDILDAWALLYKRKMRKSLDALSVETGGYDDSRLQAYLV